MVWCDFFKGVWRLKIVRRVWVKWTNLFGSFPVSFSRRRCTLLRISRTSWRRCLKGVMWKRRTAWKKCVSFSSTTLPPSTSSTRCTPRWTLNSTTKPELWPRLLIGLICVLTGPRLSQGSSEPLVCCLFFCSVLETWSVPRESADSYSGHCCVKTLSVWCVQCLAGRVDMRYNLLKTLFITLWEIK